MPDQRAVMHVAGVDMTGLSDHHWLVVTNVLDTAVDFHRDRFALAT
ncbi:hypothetical protein ABZ896_09960 [Streptomyces sp. NPDC047072]